MKFVELSHRIKDGMVTFPGIPPIKIDNYLSREESGEEFGEKAAALLDRLNIIGISGTYLDAPLHRFEKGYTIADIPLEKLVDLPTIVVKKQDNKNFFDIEDFLEIDIDIKGYAVLLHSGHDKKFGTPEYGELPPYLTIEGAKWLMKKGVVFVGIDSPLIDNMEVLGEVGTPVHDIILIAKSVICEDMRGIEQLPETGALLTAVPPAVEMASFPARVFAKVNA
jgi:kynurenine formamidase